MYKLVISDTVKFQVKLSVNDAGVKKEFSLWLEGKRLDMDQSYYECGLMAIVKAGIEGAGGNLTKKTFQEAIFKKKDFEAPGLAGGKGTLSANKPWLASSVQQINVTTMDLAKLFTSTNAADKTADAKGLYGPGRCPSPLGCWRVVPGSVKPLTYTLS